MFQLESSWAEEFPLTHMNDSRFVLFRPSIPWMGPTHIREYNLLYLADVFKRQTPSETPSQTQLE